MSTIFSWNLCRGFCFKAKELFYLTEVPLLCRGWGGTGGDHMTFSTHPPKCYLNYELDAVSAVGENWAWERCIRGMKATFQLRLPDPGFRGCGRIMNFGISSLRWIWPKLGEIEQSCAVLHLQYYRNVSNLRGLNNPGMRYQCF